MLIYLPSFLIEEEKNYVTFKPDPFNRFTIALEAVERLMLDPSISLLRLTALY